jgi:hypothetical protein
MEGRIDARGWRGALMRAARVRTFALSLPEAAEQETWGTATFRVRNKIFVMFDEKERHLWVKSTHDEQQALIAMDPDAFFFPSYVGSKGWVGVVVAKAERGEVEELITEAWRMTAPKRLVAAFDHERESA